MKGCGMWNDPLWFTTFENLHRSCLSGRADVLTAGSKVLV